MIHNPPEFFTQAPSITVYDELAQFLGASLNGHITYQYGDAVALAGHSCPTVASAFLMTRAALAALYPNETPQRGHIAVHWRNQKHEGVTGVMANVVSLITGAADEGGFHGIGGQFARNNLLKFGAAIDAEVRFTRLDNGQKVDVSADLSSVPMHPKVRELMGFCLDGEASPDEYQAFGAAWQSRVKKLLLEHADDRLVIQVRPD